MNPTPTTPEALARSTAEKIHQLHYTDYSENKVAAILLLVLSALTTERDEAVKERDDSVEQFERERRQRQLDVGSQEYRGNTVSYMYDKARAYGDIVHGCTPALAAAGYPPDESEIARCGAIANAVAKMAADMATLRAQLSALTSQHEQACRERDELRRAFTPNGALARENEALRQDVARLTTIADVHLKTGISLGADCERLRTRHARLLELVEGTLVPAILFYAEGKHYLRTGWQGDQDPSAIETDRGTRANTALSSYAATAREQTEKRGGE